MKPKQCYLSWLAIFAGAVAGVGLNFLLNLLSLGLGIRSCIGGFPGYTRSPEMSAASGNTP